MRGNAHVRFGGAGRGNRPPETAALRPDPTPTWNVCTGRSSAEPTWWACSPTTPPSTGWSPLSSSNSTTNGRWRSVATSRRPQWPDCDRPSLRRYPNPIRARSSSRAEKPASERHEEARQWHRTHRGAAEGEPCRPLQRCLRSCRRRSLLHHQPGRHRSRLLPAETTTSPRQMAVSPRASSERLLARSPRIEADGSAANTWSWRSGGSPPASWAGGCATTPSGSWSGKRRAGCWRAKPARVPVLPVGRPRDGAPERRRRPSLVLLRNDLVVCRVPDCRPQSTPVRCFAPTRAAALAKRTTSLKALSRRHIACEGGCRSPASLRLAPHLGRARKCERWPLELDLRIHIHFTPWARE